ncbi:pimeloyl-ACP methyl ester carboxylesterase [Mycobacterium sp. MAA66]|uniref:alpha/beta fold hydrolase n=1 Tax=Mycobacterium sp. MAA66 TaxID=3156297 RepID=UPI0035190AEE
MGDHADGVVFVHSGKHDGRCWSPTITSLARLQPEATTLAVDLPGRRGMPGDTNFSACVQSAMQINDAGIDSMVLVGHSLAGVTVPEIATRLGARRVRRIVAVACCVPPQGQTTADTVSVPTQLVARLLEKVPMPRWLARQMFCNGMSAEQAALSLDLLVPDAPDTPGLTRERVDRSALPSEIPRTWVLTLRDRTLPPRVQLRFASNLGAQEIVPIDTGHNPMIADPDGLAAIIAGRLSPAC